MAARKGWYAVRSAANPRIARPRRGYALIYILCVYIFGVSIEVVAYFLGDMVAYDFGELGKGGISDGFDGVEVG